jgi:hypothetical protein
MEAEGSLAPIYQTHCIWDNCDHNIYHRETLMYWEYITSITSIKS